MTLWGSRALVVAVAIATLALSGCTLTSYPRATTPPTTITGAHVGQCWQASDPSFVESMIDAGRKPVTCGRAHQFVTFSAFSLASPPSGATPAPAVSDNEQSPSVAAAAEAGCATRLAKAVPELAPFEVLVRATAILPTKSAWRSGNRLIECDLSVIKIGSSVAAPALGDVPSVENIREAARDYYNEFDFCVNLPSTLPKDGPKGAGSVYADCNQRPDWTRVDVFGAYDSDVAPGGRYPGLRLLEHSMTVRCGEAIHGKNSWAYFPTRAEWDAGTTHAECWLRHNQLG